MKRPHETALATIELLNSDVVALGLSQHDGDTEAEITLCFNDSERDAWVEINPEQASAVVTALQAAIAQCEPAPTSASADQGMPRPDMPCPRWCEICDDLGPGVLHQAWTRTGAFSVQMGIECAADSPPRPFVWVHFEDQDGELTATQARHLSDVVRDAADKLGRSL